MTINCALGTYVTTQVKINACVFSIPFSLFLWLLSSSIGYSFIVATYIRVDIAGSLSPIPPPRSCWCLGRHFYRDKASFRHFFPRRLFTAPNGVNYLNVLIVLTLKLVCTGWDEGQRQVEGAEEHANKPRPHNGSCLAYLIFIARILQPFLPSSTRVELRDYSSIDYV